MDKTIQNTPSESRDKSGDGEPPSSRVAPHLNGNGNGGNGNGHVTSMEPRTGGWFKRFFNKKNDDRLREALEELIEEEDQPDTHGGGTSSVALHERALLANILKLRDMEVIDVMVPRADIMAVEHTIGREELLKAFAENPRSRLPVYEDNLDNIVGTVHIKDVLTMIAENRTYDLSSLIRDVKVISPAMPVLDLLLEMRMTRNHMAMVVDEFGGIDGLVTLGDLIEAIIGEIEDEYDDANQPTMREVDKNILIANARMDIDEFERYIGIPLLDEDEREDVDTLAGFIFSFAGRVPVRGELIKHPYGLEFEVIDGDPRRVRKIKIRINPQLLAQAIEENS